MRPSTIVTALAAAVTTASTATACKNPYIGCEWADDMRAHFTIVNWPEDGVPLPWGYMPYCPRFCFFWEDNAKFHDLKPWNMTRNDLCIHRKADFLLHFHTHVKLCVDRYCKPIDTVQGLQHWTYFLCGWTFLPGQGDHTYGPVAHPVQENLTSPTITFTKIPKKLADTFLKSGKKGKRCGGPPI